MLNLTEAERIRKERKLTPEHFSIKIGFSANAYRKAMQRGKLSRWMAKEISQRFRVPLDCK